LHELQRIWLVGFRDQKSEREPCTEIGRFSEDPGLRSG
jgi:hypothetical protein